MIQKQIYNQYESKVQRQVLKFFHSTNGKIHNNHFGPKIYTEYQKLMLVVLYRRNNQSYRRYMNYLLESRWPKWLQLKEIPSKSSVHSWFQNLSVSVLKKLNQFVLRKIEPELLAIDATGIDSWQRSRHYEKRIGEAPMPYAKLDLVVDTNTKLVFDHVLRIKPRHDIIATTQMLKRTRLSNCKLLGDKGYDCEAIHKLARSKGIEFFAPLRTRERKRIKGFYRRKCVDGDKDYPRRSIAESVIHSLKAVNVQSLKSRLHWMKKKEMRVAIIVYNIELVANKQCFEIQLTIEFQITILDRALNRKHLKNK